jgi:dTDP-4-dehydrorhamnose reductase
VRILVTGGAGQVGSRVAEHLPHHDVVAVPRRMLDIADRDAVEQVVGELAPDVIVNTAAMTNVDACERDPDAAFAVNALGARWLAIAAARSGAHVIHVSTDYVFDGAKASPYDEWDAVHPLSEYGRSKLAGEREIEAHAPSWAVVRTSWVFGARGSDLVSWAFAAYDRGELDGVLADQISVPTYAPDLAALVARFAAERRQGLYHATSGSEATTRHELITVALRARGVDADRVAPIATVDVERPAARPPYSVLDNRALRLGGLPPLRAWRDAVTEYVKAWDDAPAGGEQPAP